LCEFSKIHFTGGLTIENRPTLKRFVEQVLDAQFEFTYPHRMVIDGNDDRGIDLGILSKFSDR